jgi:membrane protein DedA with SNARE-associated domain/membrane-associated phospholipid phosphatase
MFQTFFHQIVLYLHHHPHSAGMIAFCIAFCEALAVVGTIFPGSVSMSAIGVMIGSRVIPAGPTLIWAIFGAIGGDCLSYVIGYHYKERIYKIWPFTRYPTLLTKGKKFFYHHGGKSVIIGRFFGPMRSMVPLIAGVLHMRPVRFVLAAVPSASVWAVVYIMPGILLGALSLELPPGIAFEFIVVALLILAIIVFFLWAIRLFWVQITEKINHINRRIWVYMKKHQSRHWFTKLLSHPNHVPRHHQLNVLSVILVSIVCFIGLMICAFNPSTYAYVNHPVYYLLKSIHNDALNSFTLLFTIFGSMQVMSIICGLVLAWLAFRRCYREAIYLLIAFLGAAFFVGVFKLLFYVPRPGGLLHHLSHSSFPSGHTSLTIVLMGFLSILFAQNLSRQHRIYSYLGAAVITFFVAFSRIYLGAHWLTDVLGAMFLGLILILTLRAFYLKGKTKDFVKLDFMVICGIILSVWTVYSLFTFKKYEHNYSLFWPTYQVSLNAWQNRTAEHIPLYRLNRFGHPREVFNVEWLGKLATIKKSLLHQKWHNYEPRLTMAGFIKRISSTVTQHRISIIPDLYRNRLPVLLMVKDVQGVNGVAKRHKFVVLRLWKSNVEIEGVKHPLWVGIVSYPRVSYKDLKLRDFFRKHFGGAVEALLPYLGDYAWKQFVFTRKQQPKEIHGLHWDGKLILIRPKKI